MENKEKKLTHDINSDNSSLNGSLGDSSLNNTNNIYSIPKEGDVKIYEETRVFEQTLTEVWLVIKNQEKMIKYIYDSFRFPEEQKKFLQIKATIAQSIFFKKQIYYNVILPQRDFYATFYFTIFTNSLEDSSTSTLQIFSSPNSHFIKERIQLFAATLAKKINDHINSHKEIIKQTESTIFNFNIQNVWDYLMEYNLDKLDSKFIYDLSFKGKPSEVGCEISFMSTDGILYRKKVTLVENKSDSITWKYGIKNFEGEDNSVGVLITLIKVNENTTYLSYEHYFTTGASKEILDKMSKIKKQIFKDSKTYLENILKDKH
ncbi:MAG: hypothetical protein MJ252_18745 [archaeon]|nr:hypothetical protein [archaeon]